ncbi:MAG: prepilin peptidase [Actinobacteria bacterium]|jgi:leader peptidase (prepilin peptidase)/N-methyltransferase|nr:MAG: prepilin peptidase [Actinomycetota bacterium]
MFYEVYSSVVFFLFGLVVGSFDNVAIYRIPEGKSLWAPRSFCPQCGTTIAWYDNVPLVSYIVLRGRCRHCAKHIPVRYPLVELISGSLWLAVFAKAGFTWSIELLPNLFLVTILIIVSGIDLQKQIIPNKVIVPSIPIALACMGIVALVRGDYHVITDSLIGFAVGAVPLGILALALPRGMGMGDAKLAALTGIILGWRSEIIALFAGFFLGAIVGVLLMSLGKKGRKSRIPFGPFLSAGAIIALFWGPSLWDLYVGLF